jgi:hypothetical protein
VRRKLTLDAIRRRARIDARGCWIWQGALNADGYGITHDGERTTLAHIAAYELRYGPRARGALLLHACDVRACCCPEHLSEGTQEENMGEMVARGRAAWQRGRQEPLSWKTGAATTVSLVASRRVTR